MSDEVILQTEPFKITVHLVMKIARQIEGEFIAINAIKASTEKKVIEDFVNNLEYKPTEIINGIPCLVEIGVLHDIVIDE